VNQGKGDSGGGFYQYYMKSYTLVGVISASPNDPNLDCNIKTYSVFADVSKFVGWIQKNMKKVKVTDGLT
jgi:secreted trypsin-like serine protease